MNVLKPFELTAEQIMFTALLQVHNLWKTFQADLTRDFLINS